MEETIENKSYGLKHLISCRCILPQFKNSKTPLTHQFVVFSEVVNDRVKEKYAQCNNCGIVHKVYDLCLSEIVKGKEDSMSIVNIDEIKLAIPEKLIGILESNHCELPTWEHANYIFSNKRWGDFFVIAFEEDSEKSYGKYLQIMSETVFKVQTFSRNQMVSAK